MSSLPHINQLFHNIDGSLLSLFSWLSSPCFLTLSSQERTLDGFCGPLLGKHRFIPVFSCCSCTGEPSTWGQCSRCISVVLSRVEGSHLSTFLQNFITISHISQPFCNILPPETGIGLFLPRCWPTCNLLTIRTSRSLSAKLSSSWSIPSLPWCEGLFLPRCRIWHF